MHFRLNKTKSCVIKLRTCDSLYEIACAGIVLRRF